MNRHSLTYVDLHPEPVKPASRWPDIAWAVVCLAVFALIGVLLAWRG